MVQPYRTPPTDTGTSEPAKEQQSTKLLWEGDLYGPADGYHDPVTNDLCRVRVVRTFKQVERRNRVGADIVQISEVEVTISRDKLGARVWRPAREMSGDYASYIISALARGIPG